MSFRWLFLTEAELYQKLLERFLGSRVQKELSEYAASYLQRSEWQPKHQAFHPPTKYAALGKQSSITSVGCEEGLAVVPQLAFFLKLAWVIVTHGDAKGNLLRRLLRASSPKRIISSTLSRV